MKANRFKDDGSLGAGPAYTQSLRSTQGKSLTLLIAGENPSGDCAHELTSKGYRIHTLSSDAQKRVDIKTLNPVEYAGWRQEVERIKPDLIYATGSWESVPLAHDLLMAFPEVPFIWNLRQDPFSCISEGTWNKLLDLYTRSDGHVYPCAEMKEWVLSFLPWVRECPSLVFPDCLPGELQLPVHPAPRLSETDGRLHLASIGVPEGMSPEMAGELICRGIELHVYAPAGSEEECLVWMQEAGERGEEHLHLHRYAGIRSVEELSRYDAAWLQGASSTNYGEISAASRTDLYIPPHTAVLALAGLPLLHSDNDQHIMASQSLLKRLGTGIFFRDPQDLIAQLEDSGLMESVRGSAFSARDYFTYETHATILGSFFDRVTEKFRPEEAPVRTERTLSHPGRAGDSV
jgi:hypothetical protein